MATNTALVVILERIASKDKDFRYMATSDLLNELQKDSFKVDSELEKKLCAVVLTQLEDPSGDISNLAVSCLGHLVRKVADARVEDLVRQLCDKAAGGPKGSTGGSSAAAKAKDAAREIAAIGLKTVIKELQVGSSAVASTASNVICTKMLEALAVSKDDAEVVGQALEILTDLIHKFGGLLVAQHSAIKAALLGGMDEPRISTRKKALQGLAALSVYLNDDLLNDTVEHILAKLQVKGIKPEFARTYIQAIGQISRAVGYRFGKHLVVALPLGISFCDKAAEADDELREHCMQALEGFVVRCPHDTRAHLDVVLAAALKYLKYDPNYAADDDGDEAMSEDEGGADEEDEDGDDEEYSDDEDMSWKVRRAAAKLVSGLVARYPDALATLYKAAAAELVARFAREREEGVKADVFGAMAELLAQVGATADRYGSVEAASSPLALLASDVPSIVKAAAKQLRDKSPKTKIGVFGVLRQLVAVQPAAMASHMGTLVPGLVSALNDKSGNSGLKIEALAFLRQAMGATQPQVLQPHTKQLATPVFGCVAERYYKVAAEALRVCEALTCVMRPDLAAPVPDSQQALVQPLYNAIMARLSAADQDQEVKECAISAMAAVVGRLGDVLKAELPGVLKVLLDRLRNEITRLTTVKALTSLAASPLMGPELLAAGGVDGGVLAELTSFLRKANRLLRQASLSALEAMASKYPTAFDGAAAALAVEEAASLVADSDVALASLSLRFLNTLMAGQRSAAAAVAEKAQAPALQLVRSPLLQGGALEVLEGFFAGLATSGAAPAASLLEALLEAGRSKEAASKQAQTSVARCVAALATTSPAKVPDTVAMLLKTVGAGDAGSQRLALLCLGEIGRRVDLSGLPAAASAASAALSSPSSHEEVRSAASHALGGIAFGNLGAYMPRLVEQIKAAGGQPKQQYLLLQALNEVVASIVAVGQAKNIALSSEQVDQVLALLLGAVEGEEECRNVVAECLGRLALLHPDRVLPQLQQNTTVPSANMRSVVVSAVKFTVVERPHPVDAALSGCLLQFLLLMSDADRHVRRAAVVALSGAAHAKPGLVVGGSLAQLLPLLYAQTVIREDMIRTVDLGPFKHKIDDGLELRKAAFECLDILLDSCRDQLMADPGPFLGALESGLGDHFDVKMPCHTTLAKLAAADPGAVLAAMERLVVPLEKTLLTKLKSDAVKQEVDRHEDMLRSCLRCVDALARVPGADGSAPFQSFLKRCVAGTPGLRDKYAAIQKERAEAEGGEPMDLS